MKGARSYDLSRLAGAVRPYKLRWFASLGSTNDRAAQLRRARKVFAPAMIVTGRQLAGRGRQEGAPIQVQFLDDPLISAFELLAPTFRCAAEFFRNSRPRLALPAPFGDLPLVFGKPAAEFPEQFHPGHQLAGGFLHSHQIMGGIIERLKPADVPPLPPLQTTVTWSPSRSTWQWLRETRGSVSW